MSFQDAKEVFIISLGGSLIVPQEVDAAFLAAFKQLVADEVVRGHRFIIITGGGKTARRYQHAAAEVGQLADEDVDWLGIHATRLNAHLIRTILRDLAHPRIVTDPTHNETVTEPVLVAAGWKPGWSTDYVATLLAETYGVRRVANLSNIDYVYDSDPRTNPAAKPREHMAWDELQAIVGERWSPGMNAPFDPIATKMAATLGLTVGIMNGRDLSNVARFLHGQPFIGTTISPAVHL